MADIENHRKFHMRIELFEAFRTQSADRFINKFLPMIKYFANKE